MIQEITVEITKNEIEAVVNKNEIVVSITQNLTESLLSNLFVHLSAYTTEGDILVGSGAGLITALSKGTTGQVLGINNNGDVAYIDVQSPIQDTDDLPEGTTNLYFTDLRARSAISSSATGLSYDEETGIFTLQTGYQIPTNINVSNWNDAYSWGNHAGLYSLLGHNHDSLYDALGTASSLITAHNNTFDHSLIATALQSEIDPIFSAWLLDPTVDLLKYNTAYSPTGLEPVGTTYWDSANHTYSSVLENGVIGQHFKELFIDGQNDTGSTILNGTPVSYAGSIGNSGNFRIKKAKALSTEPAFYFVGILTHDVDNGNIGKITTHGKVRGIQTNGANYGETWTNGDIIYVSGATAGYLTKTPPEAPIPAIPVALVVSAHATNGTLEIRPTFPVSLQELSDVNGTELTTSGQILVWNNTSKVFDFTDNINNYSLTTHNHNGVYQPVGDYALNSSLTSYLKLDQTTPQTTVGIFTFPTIKSSSYLDLYGNIPFVSQNGSITYHQRQWFVPASGQSLTINADGTRATLSNPVTDFQFSSYMVGAKIIVNGIERVITNYISVSAVSISAFPSTMWNQVYLYTQWGVYNKALEIPSAGTVKVYGYTSGGNGGSLILDPNVSLMISGGNAGIVGDNFGYFSNETVFANSYFVKWSSDTNKFGTKDLGLKRNSAGILEINNGTAGTYRDLILRGLTADTNTLFIDSTNHRVGIGTTIPDTKLQVDVASGDALKLRNSTYTSTLNFGTNSSGWTISSTSGFSFVSGNSFSFATNASISSGNWFNLGASYYTIAGSSGEQSILAITGGVRQSGTAGYSTILVNAIETSVGSGNKYLMSLRNNSVDKFNVTSVGNVGIGTSSPTSKLHVYGTDQLLIFGDGSSTNDAYGSFNGRAFFGFDASDGLLLQTTTTRPINIAHGDAWGINTSRIYIKTDGNLGVGTTTPTACLHIKAGTATASTAPIKFTSGTSLTTPENGAMEYDGTDLYFTPSGATRKTIAYIDERMNVLTADTVEATYALQLNIQTNILNTLPNGVNSNFTLPTAIAGQLNESVVHFSTGATLPTIVYSGFTPVWLNGTAPTLVANKSYTFVFEQIRTATSTWVVKASWGQY